MEKNNTTPPPVGGLELIECPRDAIQGIKHWIETDKKAQYINFLLESGLFHTIDFGSFVSPKAIPQMADTADVLKKINLSHKKTQLLAIIANERGANDALAFEEIDYLGYPFSISETFQIRNTNATIEESLSRVEAIQNLIEQKNKKLVLYISMGFGNPYGDEWNAEIALKWVDKLKELGIQIFSLSDTIGVAAPKAIHYLFENLIKSHPKLEFGAHFHTTPDTWKEKIETAYKAGCRRFDGAMMGYGGCPMAQDDLVGNMPMENLLRFFNFDKGKESQIENLKLAFQELIL